MNQKQIKVFLVDDHRMFREGVRSRLEKEPEFEIVGEAGTGAESLKQIAEAAPSVVILDIRLPDMSGIEVARTIRNQWPNVKILVLTGYDFDQYVRALMRVGVEGYLLKDAPQDSLVDAIREIYKGGGILPPTIASKVIRSYTATPPTAEQKTAWELTIREIEILELLYQGMKNQEISEKLDISVRTVEAHVASIIGKLGAQSRTDAVRIAVERGLIK